MTYTIRMFIDHIAFPSAPIVVDDSNPRPAIGDVLDDKWRVLGVFNRNPNEVELEVESVFTIKHQERYRGFEVEELVDPDSRTGRFHVLSAVLKKSPSSSSQRWSSQKSGFATSNDAMEYGIKQAKDWIDQQLSGVVASVGA